MKMKSLLMLLVCLIMMLTAAAAEETDADTLLLQELNEWAERYHSRAMGEEPLNDPRESLTEDGYEFIYEFATIYADAPVMNADTVINAVVIVSDEEEGPRGTRVDDSMDVVLSAFYNENESLNGSREAATLYLVDMMPETLQWAQVQRDGQRVDTIQYAVHDQLTTGGDGYTDAGVIYTIQSGTVSAIRVYGLNARISLDEAYNMRSVLFAESMEQGYTRVKTSFIGSELTPFDGVDLQFSGLDFMGLTPESVMFVLGQPEEDVWVEDGENGFIRTMIFPDVEITFLCDAQKENARIYMLMILSDDFEGPRAVRMGDMFADVHNRFLNGEGEFDGEFTEVLYGSEASGTFGMAVYGMDASATLRYGLVLEDGQRVVLHMGFTAMELSEIMVYVEE